MTIQAAAVATAHDALVEQLDAHRLDGLVELGRLSSRAVVFLETSGRARPGPRSWLPAPRKPVLDKHLC